jgi:hypothetical protein
MSVIMDGWTAKQGAVTPTKTNASKTVLKNVVFWDKKPSSHFTGDTLHLCYKVQPVNAM